ncbi:hypothetical protein BDA99DRAFT_517437, partial [Phascolomyces articulosus]
MPQSNAVSGMHQKNFSPSIFMNKPGEMHERNDTIHLGSFSLRYGTILYRRGCG